MTHRVCTSQTVPIYAPCSVWYISTDMWASYPLFRVLCTNARTRSPRRTSIQCSRHKHVHKFHHNLMITSFCVQHIKKQRPDSSSSSSRNNKTWPWLTAWTSIRRKFIWTKLVMFRTDPFTSNLYLLQVSDTNFYITFGTNQHTFETRYMYTQSVRFSFLHVWRVGIGMLVFPIIFNISLDNSQK